MNRRGTLALAASLVAHLALWLVLVRAGPTPRLDAPPQTTLDVEIELRVQPPSPPSGGGELRLSGNAAGGGAGKSRTASSPRAIGPRSAAASSVASPALAAGPEARPLDLSIPERAAAAGSDGVQDPGGLAVRNDGRAELQLHAVETTRATQRRIEGWVEESKAAGRAQNGEVDPYFGSLAFALHDSLRQAASGHERELQPGLLAGWSVAAQQYGATGNPSQHLTPPSRMDSPIAPAFEAMPGGGGAIGRSAIVEIRLHADGGLQASLLVQGSGDARFDRLVLASVPLALHGLPPPSLDGGLGLHGFGSRSLWAFEEQLFVPSDPISFLIPVVERALGATGPLTLQVRLLEVY
jgi:hypothetical protein